MEIYADVQEFSVSTAWEINQDIKSEGKILQNNIQLWNIELQLKQRKSLRKSFFNPYLIIYGVKKKFVKLRIMMISHQYNIADDDDEGEEDEDDDEEDDDDDNVY